MKSSDHKQDNQAKARLVLGYYWRHIMTYPRYVLGLCLSIPFTVILNNFVPTLIVAVTLKKLAVQTSSSASLWHDFGPTLLLYTAVVLSGLIGWRIVDYFMWRLEIKTMQNIAEEVFSHLISRSGDFHANRFGGSLVSQSNKLLGSYPRVADTTIYQVYPTAVTIIATIVILTPKAPQFVAVLTVMAAIYLFAAIKISEPIRRISAKWATAESKQTGTLADAITNVMTIKSYAHSRYEKTRFHRATQQTRQYAFGFASKHQTQMNIFGFIGRSIQAAALLLAVLAVRRWHSDVSVVFLIVSYTGAIAEQLFRFGNDSLRAYNRSFGDAYDMAKTLSETPEIMDIENPEPSGIDRGEIELRGVTFKHSGASKTIFQDFNLHIKPGEKIGLVGHSGSGKTTFTRLLMRFSDIDAGQILIDGQNIAKISQDDLHRAIAFVPQEPMLFHRTLAENIAYGKLDASQAEIVAAAAAANATEFVAELPDGFDTLVGERGVKLSGGQRQRVAIARAMLKDAPILVLDEATSALDSESEALIQEALLKLMEGRTTIAIAHRLSTIQHMDRIVVLDQGAIVEMGTHRELLDKAGTYAKFWARQSGGFIDE